MYRWVDTSEEIVSRTFIDVGDTLDLVFGKFSTRFILDSENDVEYKGLSTKERSFSGVVQKPIGDNSKIIKGLGISYFHGSKDLFTYGEFSLAAWSIDGVAGGDTALLDVNNSTSTLPGKYSLEQNYPNPFNPSTSIKYSIPKAGQVKLNVYSVTGKLVANLVDEFKTAGNYTVNFNAVNLASGVYFYRLSSGSFVENKKMILVK